jgi:hypothetical protein
MASEMSTSEVLNKAADLIEERGWATGPEAWGTGSSLCLEGGILAAMGMTEDYLSGSAQSWHAFRGCRAYGAVRDYLTSTGDLDPDESLWKFNDESAAERVIGVLRATALIEAARERESVEV